LSGRIAHRFFLPGVRYGDRYLCRRLSLPSARCERKRRLPRELALIASNTPLVHGKLLKELCPTKARLTMTSVNVGMIASLSAKYNHEPILRRHPLLE
jgi:hypothetical protein